MSEQALMDKVMLPFIENVVAIAEQVEMTDSIAELDRNPLYKDFNVWVTTAIPIARAYVEETEGLELWDGDIIKSIINDKSFKPQNPHFAVQLSGIDQICTYIQNNSHKRFLQKLKKDGLGSFSKEKPGTYFTQIDNLVEWMIEELGEGMFIILAATIVNIYNMELVPKFLTGSPFGKAQDFLMRTEQ